MTTDLITAVQTGVLILPPGRDLSPAEQAGLSLPNPDHRRWKSLRRKYSRMPEPPKQIASWGALPPPHPWAGAVVLPRQAPRPEGMVVLDRTVAPEAPPLESRWELRPYQARALRSWVDDGRQGVVLAPCGAGKTVIGCAAIGATPTTALVLVHTLDLAKQWQDRLQAQLGVQATLLGGGQRQAPGRVTIATFQTLATMEPADLAAFGRVFGLVIVDEAHHVPAATFAAVLSALPGRFRLGLTATPDREDGLEQLLWWHLGHVVAEIQSAELREAGVIMAPTVYQFPSGWHGPMEFEWTELLEQAANDTVRNQRMLDQIDQLARDGRQVLVLTQRVEHASLLARRCNRLGHSAAELTGKMSKVNRAEVLLRASKGLLSVVTATTVADEGLDLPDLDALVLALPCKASGRLEQRVGRVMRASQGKRTPLVLDLVDEHPGLVRLAQTRAALYRRLGATVRRGPPPPDPKR